MQLLEFGYFMNIVNSLEKWVETFVQTKIDEALANRPQTYFVSQDDYDALVESDAVDPTAVYMISEEDEAAVSQIETQTLTEQ